VDEQAESLRYGNIGIMTDPDDDGTDIKCQLVNIFLWEFPKLCRNQTPHDDSNANTALKFYEYVLPVSEGEYRFGRKPFLKEDDQVHFNQRHQSELLHISYIKGLGSFNTEDAVKRLRRHNSPPPIKRLICDEEAERMANIAFGGASEADRKSYVHSYQQNWRDMSKTQTDFSELLQTDFVRYMVRDVTRKIPSVMDGLVESKRKVVYVVQQVMPNGEKMKTAQLGSETANRTNYHHDENTLSKGIVPLAADYTGAANLPLLVGEGQFGTREYDGKNFASPRYTHVRPHKNLHLLFKRRFELCLKHTEAEGQDVEFAFFVAPVIGYNAMQGTASGCRCMVHPRNVQSLVQLYKRRLHGELGSFHYADKDLLKPWYNGWDGSIEQNHNGKWVSHGCCHYKGKDRNGYAEYRVTTLPVTNGIQNTGNYEEQLGNWHKKGWIAHWQPKHTDEDICFAVYLSREQQEKADEKRNGVAEYLGLVQTVHKDTATALDEHGRVKDFGKGDQGFCAMMERHYEVALMKYHELKIKLEERAEQEFTKAKQRKEYAELLMADPEFLRQLEQNEEETNVLEDWGFNRIAGDGDGGYAHLLDMPTRLQFSNRFRSLLNDVDKKWTKWQRIHNKSAIGIWLDDLQHLEEGRQDERDNEYDVRDEGNHELPVAPSLSPSPNSDAEQELASDDNMSDDNNNNNNNESESSDAGSDDGGDTDNHTDLDHRYSACNADISLHLRLSRASPSRLFLLSFSTMNCTYRIGLRRMRYAEEW